MEREQTQWGPIAKPIDFECVELAIKFEASWILFILDNW